MQLSWYETCLHAGLPFRSRHLSLQSFSLRAGLPAMAFQECLALVFSFNSRTFAISSDAQGRGADILEGERERDGRRAAGVLSIFVSVERRRRRGPSRGEPSGDFERPVEGRGRSEGAGAIRCRTGGGTLAEATRCGRSWSATILKRLLSSSSSSVGI